nr:MULTISPECIES: Flp family type IVb pilin [unclassified Sphingomonas]
MKPTRPSVKAVICTVSRLVRDSRAATAIEYGLIAALIVVGVIAAIGGVGTVTSGMWNNTSARVSAVTPR